MMNIGNQCVCADGTTMPGGTLPGKGSSCRKLSHILRYQTVAPVLTSDGKPYATKQICLLHFVCMETRPVITLGRRRLMKSLWELQHLVGRPLNCDEMASGPGSDDHL